MQEKRFKRVFSAFLAFLIVVGLAGAYLLGKERNAITTQAIRAVVGERLDLLDGIEGRLKRLEDDVAAMRRPSPTEMVKGTEAPAIDADRWAALESSLSTLRLRVKGLEEDPIRRGESFLESEDAEMRREGINLLRRVARFDPNVRARIRGLLQDQSSRVKEQAAQILRDIADKESASEMKALLTDQDSSTRRRAVQALAAMDARDTAQDIGGILLADPDDGVRVAAADALGKLKAQETSAALSEALKDRNEMVRGEAIVSLGEIGATAAVPLLRAIYERDPGNHRVRLALTLKSLGDDAPLQSEVSRLSEILKSETDQRLRQEAQRQLALLTRNTSQ